MKATEKQVGGEHYKKLAIQPMEYSIKNNLDPLQASVIKYVTRHKDKAGRVDIEKAMHCLELILEMQYPQTSPSPEELEKGLKDWAANARFEAVPAVKYTKEEVEQMLADTNLTAEAISTSLFDLLQQGRLSMSDYVHTVAKLVKSDLAKSPALFTPESYKTQRVPAGACSGCMFFNNPVCSSPGVELTTYCAENSIIYTGQK